MQMADEIDGENGIVARAQPRARGEQALAEARNGLDQPALVSRARGASQPSVAAERFLMITLPGCLWCKRPFRARRGGSPKRFCCAAHRIAFWSAARRWAERAVVSGLLSVDDIRNDPTEACRFSWGPSRLRRYGRLSDLPP
jgi:hypothetical protein